jgi:hypothetical protein
MSFAAEEGAVSSGFFVWALAIGPVASARRRTRQIEPAFERRLQGGGNVRFAVLGIFSEQDFTFQNPFARLKNR